MRFKKTKIIVNPLANHGETRNKVDTIKNFFKDRLNFDLEITKAPKHAVEIAQKLHDYDLVVAVGGDGTVFEVANGLALSNNKKTVLGIIPTGSGNDLRFALKIPKKIQQACAVILTGEAKTIDLGIVNGVYYTNSLGIGFDARVAHLANQIKDEVKKSGIPLYLTALFRILFADYYCHEVSIKIDDREWENKKIVLIAANNGPTYGGGFKITPDAKNTDGLLEVCVVDKLTSTQVIPRLPLVIMGKHKIMKQAHFYQAKKVIIRAEEELPAHLDGELMKDKNFLVEIVPQALKVLVPRIKGRNPWI